MPALLIPAALPVPICPRQAAFGFGSAALLLLGCLSGCSENRAAAEPAEQPLPELRAETVQVEPAVWPTIVRSQGSLQADEVSTVGTRVAGRIAEIHVDLGDRVATGDPLAELETEEFQLLVDQAQAQLEQSRSALGLGPDDPVSKLDPANAPPVRQERAVWEEARASLKRAESLVQRNAMAPGEFDQLAAAERVAEARYAAALNGVREKIALIGVRQAELSLARQRLSDAVIRAPFDGLVQRRSAAPGAYLNVGDEVAVLVRTNPLRFRGTLPERYAQSLTLGQPVELQIQSVLEPRTAQVARISPTLDQLSRSLMFEVPIDNPDDQLRTGLFSEAEIIVDAKAEALAVPLSAVTRFAGAEKVWKIVDGVAREQEVFTGERRGERVEVLQGLAAGDVILRDATRGRVARILPELTANEPTPPDAVRPDAVRPDAMQPNTTALGVVPSGR